MICHKTFSENPYEKNSTSNFDRKEKYSKISQTQREETASTNFSKGNEIYQKMSKANTGRYKIKIDAEEVRKREVINRIKNRLKK